MGVYRDLYRDIQGYNIVYTEAWQEKLSFNRLPVFFFYSFNHYLLCLLTLLVYLLAKRLLSETLVVVTVTYFNMTAALFCIRTGPRPGTPTRLCFLATLYHGMFNT